MIRSPKIERSDFVAAVLADRRGAAHGYGPGQGLSSAWGSANFFVTKIIMILNLNLTLINSRF
jgi:hypothetical protein